MMIFDHLKLVRRNDHELRRFRAYVSNLQGGHAEAMAVEHEHDDSCCREEPWPETLRRIMPRERRTLIVET
jgi:hypothetical protein